MAETAGSSGVLVSTKVDGHDTKIIHARDLRYTDRGRLVMIETPAAVYVGNIQSIIFHAHGQVQVRLERSGAEATTTLKERDCIAVSEVWGEVKTLA